MKRQDTTLSSVAADRIVAILEDRPLDAAAWEKKMKRLEKEMGTDVYSVLLFVLTHLDFSATKAREHWERILRQWSELNNSLKDPVDLRVAVLHYFLRIQKKLKNPTIVELKILRQTQDSVITDELTKLHNFRHFQDQIRTETRRTEREEATLGLLMIDIDDFKLFNDTHGHLAGNVALRRVASALKRAVRETDSAARYGGEEFAVLLPHTPKTGALKVAEKIRRGIEKAAIGRGKGQEAEGLTVSIGLATMPGDASTVKELIERADSALYVAKSVGKNCVRPYSDERREYCRLDTVVTGRFSLVDSQSHILTTLNVSEGGLLFLSEEPPNKGALAQVQLALPQEKGTIEGLLRVMRVSPVQNGYEIGTEIVHMSQPDRRRFRIFLGKLKKGETIHLLPPRRARRPARRKAPTRAAKTA